MYHRVGDLVMSPDGQVMLVVDREPQTGFLRCLTVDLDGRDIDPDLVNPYYSLEV